MGVFFQETKVELIKEPWIYFCRLSPIWRVIKIKKCHSFYFNYYAKYYSNNSIHFIK